MRIVGLSHAPKTRRVSEGVVRCRYLVFREGCLVFGSPFLVCIVLGFLDAFELQLRQRHTREGLLFLAAVSLLPLSPL